MHIQTQAGSIPTSGQRAKGYGDRGALNDRSLLETAQRWSLGRDRVRGSLTQYGTASANLPKGPKGLRPC